MPRIYLSSAPLDVSFAHNGVLTLGPNSEGVSRVLLRRLKCPLRYTGVNTGTVIVRQAVVDTGAPLSCFPKSVWETDFGWQEGIDYERLTVPGVSQLRGSVLGYNYDFCLVRIMQTIEVVSIRPPFHALPSAR